jgi:uncharacterized membrane protein
VSDADDRIELTVSQLLRVGVLAAAAVIALGLALVLIRGHSGYGAGSVAQFRDEANALDPNAHGAAALGRALAAGEPGAIVQLGILLLMLTPVMRVVATAFVFLARGDRAMAAISGVVLLVLVMSALGLVSPH